MNQIELGLEYSQHEVFLLLTELAEFYNSLSDITLSYITPGTPTILNIDTYVFTSIKGTVESIRDILIKGRINDSYALLRKYYDVTIINIYTNLYINDHFSNINLIVEQIAKWLKETNATKKTKDSIPDYGEISRYIRKSAKLKPITDMLMKEELYKNIRERCNAHLHYNYYHHLLINDNEIYRKDRLKLLDTFKADISALLLQHFAYLFYLKDHYMMSSDYEDCLDMGMKPMEGSEYWVAPFIQKAFDKWIKPIRPDIASVIQANTSMKLV